MKKTRYPKGIETQHQIVEAAKHLFYLNGYEKTTMTEICKKIDIKGGTLTYYFPKKKDIVSKIYQDLNQNIRDNLYDTSMGILRYITRGTFVIYLSFLQNEKTIRFHSEVLHNESVRDYVGQLPFILYHQLNEELKLGLGKEALADAGIADLGIRREFMLNFLEEHQNGIIPRSEIFAYCDKILILFGRIFTVPEMIMKNEIEIAHEFIDKNDISDIHFLL
ncbi:TetR/AcrR family transcriptional regulator [Alkalibacter mobilis]|uniref:TetR/AcrR family transcriptional regulator n=1 Tax=Alkalibacter mobilis TaxID=2787712 RepID=UPI00189FA2C8|nr:TetR/AcrR family transcriptional regulator [Alkalibacter mobilis]MBF7097776.1 TetR/AcrR family transcriptional regulator [Alkalibacter mobilis]